MTIRFATMKQYDATYLLRASRLIMLTLVGALVAVLFTACFTEGDGEGIATGDRLPTFSVLLDGGVSYASNGEVTNLAGTRFDSSIRDGQGVVVVFFHTQCPDCQRELPLLDALYREGRLTGRRIVCISREEDGASVAAFWSAHTLSLPFSAQPDRSIYNLFASSGIPRIYVSDATGIITAVGVERNLGSLLKDQ